MTAPTVISPAGPSLRDIARLFPIAVLGVAAFVAGSTEGLIATAALGAGVAQSGSI